MDFITNALYAVKALWRVSRRRVLHMLLSSAMGYFEWIFTSIFFMRYVIRSIENEAPFSVVAGFILISAAVLGSCALYENYISAVVNPLTGNNIRRGLYTLLYAKAQNVELRCYEAASFYDRYTMALDNADGRVVSSASTVFNIVFGVIASIAAFYSMYTIDPYSVLFVISPLLGNFLFGAVSAKIWGKRYTENMPHDRKAQYVNRVMYLAEYAKEIRMSNIFNIMKRRYDEAIAGNQAVADKYAAKGAIFAWLSNVTTFALVFEGIMIYAAYRAIVSRTMGLAELAIMFSAMVATSWIFIGLFRNINDMLNNGVFIGYLRGFLEYKEEIAEDHDGELPENTVRSIEFRRVSFSYKDGQKVVDNVSFVIHGGQTAAFAGHNGAGKTTLVKLLLRLYDPTEGEILVNGVNIKMYRLKAYRELFAAAFQDYKLFSLSVSDNVLPDDDYSDKSRTVEEALKRAGIWEEIQSRPDGVNTTLTKEFDENGAVLSDQNAQKIVVARAFAKQAPVRIYDEPSSALDPIAEYNLYTSIMAASKGHTTVFISHRLSSVADADVVFVLENGSLAEWGSHKELMARGGTYAEMFTMQARSYLADEEAVLC